MHIRTKLLCLCLLAFSLPGGAGIAAQGDRRFDIDKNLPYNLRPGDLNPQTGAVTVSVNDLELPGRAGMDFTFGRTWSSSQANIYTMYRDPHGDYNRLGADTVASRNGFGAGWSSNLPSIYEDTSSGEKLMYLLAEGAIYEIDQTGIAIRNPAKSNLLWYDLLDKRLYRDADIAYGDGEYFAAGDFGVFGVADEAPDRSAYVLIYADNAKTWFRTDGRVMMREDRSGLNEIWYYYDDKGNLVLAVDTVGRKIRFSYDAQGNLHKLSWDVSLRKKLPDGRRVVETETRTVVYEYKPLNDATGFPRTAALKPLVVQYRQPFVLVKVVNAMGIATEMDYAEREASFTYDDNTSHANNVWAMLTAVKNAPGTTGAFLNQRRFEYEAPAKGNFRKYFYKGYMEYFKVSREYLIDRHGRTMNDTRYSYFDQGENGNYRSYTTVAESGGLKTVYRYSVSGERSRDDVLDTVLTTSTDGFSQLTDYAYAPDRSKILEEVYRQGGFAYREKFQFDAKGNLVRHEDRAGLVSVSEYDEVYGVPIREYRTFSNGGSESTYQNERSIDSFGRIETETLFVEKDGAKQPLILAHYVYDRYGNPIRRTDAEGNTLRLSYDQETNAFPVRTWQDVTVASWADGRDVHANWLSPPDGITKIVQENRKTFNSDGTVWLDVDAEGFATEYFYDSLETLVEKVLPDADDASVESESFLASRGNNPGSRMLTDYYADRSTTISDFDKKTGSTTTSATQRDGLGHIEEEIILDSSGAVYAVKRMDYDTQGRLVASTEPDAAPDGARLAVNGTALTRHDKTWIVKNDALGRPLMVLYPDLDSGRSDRRTFSYDDAENSLTMVDPDGRITYERRDWSGRLIESTARGFGGEIPERTVYGYDALGRKTSFTDAKGSSVSYRYDERDLLVEQIYDGGLSDKLVYDNLGRLREKTDRKGQVLVFAYDELGRNTSLLHYRDRAGQQSGTALRAVSTVYDKRGNIARVESDTLIEHYVYDARNRVARLDRRLRETALRDEIATVWSGVSETQVFSFLYAYNDAGMLVSMTYPDDSVHRFDYDSALGRLEAISEGPASGTPAPFVTDFEYNRAGQVTRMTYANSTRQTWAFNNRGWIAGIRVESGTARVLVDQLAYTFSPGGNILAINDSEYEFDGFNRLSGAATKLPENTDYLKLVQAHFGAYRGGTSTSASYIDRADLNQDGRVNGQDHALATYTPRGELYDLESYNYDPAGNRSSLRQNGDEYGYEYGPQNTLSRIFLKKKGLASKTLFASFDYDANGNTTRQTLYKTGVAKETIYSYDTFNRLVATKENGVQTTYAYDNAGNRLYRRGPDGLTLYLRHGQIAVAMDVEIYASGASNPTAKRGSIRRYILSGDLVAGCVTADLASDGTWTSHKSYYHLDHLNSTKTVTDERGNVEVSYTYRPFGEQLREIGTADATYTYSGKELDDTQLYYFNARYYNPATGRFINVDPIQDGSNWYIYCADNPLSFKDPTGLRHRANGHDDYNSNSSVAHEAGYDLRMAGYSVASRTTRSSGIGSRVRQTDPGLVGPAATEACYYRVLQSFAEDYAGVNLTLSEVNSATNAMIDVGALRSDYTVIDAQKVITDALSRLGVESAEVRVAKNTDKDFNEIRDSATGSIRAVGRRDHPEIAGHYQAGDSNGAFVWDPKDGARGSDRREYPSQTSYVRIREE